MLCAPATRVVGAALAGLLIAVLAVAQAQASQVSIRPLGLTFEADRSVETFRVRNPGRDPVTVQLEAFSWSQGRHGDELSPTRELLITPPIFTLPPSATQLVRVGLRRAPDPDRELSYRVRFTEVPPPRKPGFTGLAVTLQVSVPVFVEPSVSTAAAPRWHARMDGDGRVDLTVENRGNAHLKLTEVGVLVEGAEIGRARLLKYVLPGRSRALTVPVSRSVSPGTNLEIEARTGRSAQSFRVRVD